MSLLSNLGPPLNHLLAALPQSDFLRMAPYLQHISWVQGHVLHEEGANTESVYFPDTGMISLVLTSVQGTIVEVGLVGCEGMVGAGTALADGIAVGRAMVQVDGSGWLMHAAAFREEFERGGPFQRLVLRHLQVLSVQLAQYALCNRLHTVEERLCRWLLQVRATVHSDTFELTHEFLSQMLGTRRSGITEAAGVLRAAHLIDYKRGCIVILDRDGLEQRACECHTIIHKQLQRRLP